MDEWTSNDEEEHRPIKDTYREDYERKKEDAEENAAIFGFVLSLVMLCFQIANCIVGNNCECPFIESIPTILQVCGGFGIVLFATVYVAAKYFTKWECCGLVCLAVLAMDILGYIGCLIAAAVVAFGNYSTWTEGNHESCDCFDYTFWMVLANFALFIVACIIFIRIGIKNSSL